MPAVAQPGSRAGLITALVIFVLLFFVAAFFAVTQTNEKKAAEQELKRKLDPYEKLVPKSEMEEARTYHEQKLQDPTARGRGVFDLMRAERNELAKALSGFPDRSTKEVLDDANQKVATAGKTLAPLNVQVQLSPITSAIPELATIIVRERGQVGESATKAAAVEENLKKQIENYEAQIKQHKDAVVAAENKAAAAKAEADAYRQKKDSDVVTLEKGQTETIQKSSKEKEEFETKIATLNAEIEKLTKELKKTRDRLLRWRQLNTADPSIRRADGHIVQVAKNNVCYINLGQGQHVTRGMTFEVYSKEDGMPPSGSDENLPEGKASLEVVNVGPGTSECRLIRVNTGVQVLDGDIIANLIYDLNVKWTFKVYGKFDIDQNNLATEGEADIVKRLITEWGGKITDKIDVDTDFLVMGKEPVIQHLSPDELQEPTKKLQREKEEAALKEYEDVKTKALELHIPVLSQNRFLYLVGFYDQGKRMPG